MNYLSSSDAFPRKHATGKHPTYRGIHSRGGKWVSEIRKPRKSTRIWLGTYQRPEMAAAAYDVAARALKGSEAVINFPERVHLYPIPESHSSEAIRFAARAAAALNKDFFVREDEITMFGGESYVVDEEAVFGMHNLLVEMAGGMMVSPPRINSPQPDVWAGESLWSYDS